MGNNVTDTTKSTEGQSNHVATVEPTCDCGPVQRLSPIDCPHCAAGTKASHEHKPTHDGEEPFSTYCPPDNPPWIETLLSSTPNLKKILLPRKRDNFVTGALMSCAGLFERYDVYRRDDDEAGLHEMHVLVQFGSRTCGHDGIVHGGATATVFDDLFGWLFEYAEEKCYTASLTTNYRRPIPVHKTVLFSLRVERREGRKLFACGEARDGPEGEIYAQSNTLYIMARKEST